VLSQSLGPPSCSSKTLNSIAFGVGSSAPQVRITDQHSELVWHLEALAAAVAQNSLYSRRTIVNQHHSTAVDNEQCITTMISAEHSSRATRQQHNRAVQWHNTEQGPFMAQHRARHLQQQGQQTAPLAASTPAKRELSFL